MKNTAKASELLMFASGYIYRLLRNEARNLGVRWTAIMVLKDLDLLGSLNQKELADIEQISKPTMTVLLQQMEENGWISRVVDPDNARFNIVNISKKGRQQLRSIGKYLTERLEAELKGLPDDAIKSIEQGLNPLVSMWINQIKKTETKNTES